jgi:hypothetical protein
MVYSGSGPAQFSNQSVAIHGYFGNYRFEFGQLHLEPGIVVIEADIVSDVEAI